MTYPRFFSPGKMRVFLQCYDREEGASRVEEQIYRGADFVCPKVGGDGYAGGGGDRSRGRFRADILTLETEVRWLGGCECGA